MMLNFFTGTLVTAVILAIVLLLERAKARQVKEREDGGYLIHLPKAIPIIGVMGIILGVILQLGLLWEHSQTRDPSLPALLLVPVAFILMGLFLVVLGIGKSHLIYGDHLDYGYGYCRRREVFYQEIERVEYGAGSQAVVLVLKAGGKLRVDVQTKGLVHLLSALRDYGFSLAALPANLQQLLPIRGSQEAG